MIIGPLLVPECARTSRRGWGLVIRALAAVTFAAPALVGFWWWWMSRTLSDQYQPGGVIPFVLFTMVAIAVTIALVLSPAILAGSLAGEKERGSIGLLLSTRVDAREIVLGRLFGKLSLVFAMILTGLPFLVTFGFLNDLSFVAMLCLVALPLALSFGIGGLAMAASAIARRGRNALIAIYLVGAACLVAPELLGWLASAKYPGLASFLIAFNPYPTIFPLVTGTNAGPALACILVWCVLGAVGATVASFRLRPSFLALVGGKARGDVRRWKIPAVDEGRPMLWKELYIERIGALGWFGRVLGVLLMIYLVAGTAIVAGLALWNLFYRHDETSYDRYVTMLSRLYEDPAFLVSILIQLAIGLRAAVTISSERERGTWDALLTSPLSGREILVGKLLGSLHSLRYFLAAIVVSWGVSLALGAMSWSTFIPAVALTVIISAFIAAVGVRASLSSATATKAMSITIGTWLAAGLGLSALSALIVFVMALTCLVAWLVARPLGLVPSNSRPFFPVYLFDEGWFVLMAAMYISITSSIILASRASFDQIAGRLKGDGSDRPPAPRIVQEPKSKEAREEVLADSA